MLRLDLLFGLFFGLFWLCFSTLGKSFLFFGFGERCTPVGDDLVGPDAPEEGKWACHVLFFFDDFGHPADEFDLDTLPPCEEPDLVKAVEVLGVLGVGQADLPQLLVEAVEYACVKVAVIFDVLDASSALKQRTGLPPRPEVNLSDLL